MSASRLMIRITFPDLIGDDIKIDGTTLLSEKTVDKTYSMLNELLMDYLDEMEEEPTDEEYRETFVTLCYYLMLREMETLRLLPAQEESFKDRLASGKRIQKLPRRKKGE